MGRKIKPTAFRIGIVKPWLSRWFFKGGYAEYLRQDELIRKIVNKMAGQGGIVDIEIARKMGECKVNIRAARPGIIIGRGGEGITKLTKTLEKALRKEAKEATPSLNINIEELRRTEVSARLLAQQIAWDLEKRFRFRRTIKKYIDQIDQNRSVKGVKIKVSGRLDGAEIARSEWLVRGTIPLQTIRADIDYGEATAFTTYGTIGIKTWINKGEIFEKEEK